MSSDFSERLRVELDSWESGVPQPGKLIDTIRAVVELHKPEPSNYGQECRGCDSEGYDWEWPAWPCRTIQAIAHELGVQP